MRTWWVGMTVIFIFCAQACWSATIMLDDFENDNAVALLRGDFCPESTVHLSTYMPFSGKSFADVQYKFSRACEQESVEVYLRPNHILAPCTRLSLAVRGDGSRNTLLAKVIDAHQEVFLYPLGDLQSTQWTEESADFTSPAAAISGGDENRTLDYPICIKSLMIACQTRYSEGEIAVDAVKITTDKDADESVALPSGKIVMMNDFEQQLPPLEVHTQEQPSITFSTEHPFNGMRCAALHYKFTQMVDQTISIWMMGPPIWLPKQVHRVQIAARGTHPGRNTEMSILLCDVNGITFQYDFLPIEGTAWQTRWVDLDSQAVDVWGVIDKTRLPVAPITIMAIFVTPPVDWDKKTPLEGDVFFDDLTAFVDE